MTKLEKYRYWELKSYCRQYDYYKKQLLKAMNIKPKEYYLNRCRLIEQSAVEANNDIYIYIIRSVTQGMTYEQLNVPCGRRQFYEARRKFFEILADKI